MIIFENISNEIPYKLFEEKYAEAIEADQQTIEAISISSFCKRTDEVHSRFVNLKYVWLISNNAFQIGKNDK